MNLKESLHVPWYVVLTAIMVLVLCALRIIAFWVEGTSDDIITQALTATLALFTGSFVLARAANNGKNGKDGENKP